MITILSAAFVLSSLLAFLDLPLALEIGSPCVDKFSKKGGICRLPRDCPSASRKASQGIAPTICAFKFGSVVVCCEHEPLPNENSLLFPVDGGGFVFPGEVDDSDPEPPPAANSVGVSEKKCKEYSKYFMDSFVILPLLTVPDPTEYNFAKCDHDGVALIVGGKPAAPGEFPFMAAIYFDDGEWKCGGTLISERFVLTAAHCFKHNNRPTKVKLGVLFLNKPDESGDLTEIEIDRIITHPGYRPPKKYNDIALLKLKKDVIFTKFVRPACLWSQPSTNERKAVATGWGMTSYGGENSEGLLKVALDLLDMSKCRRTYGVDKKHLPNGVVGTMICAGDLKGKKDTCQGDSGGPLLITQPNNNCIHHVIGVTSFGITCAAPNTPGIYTKVSDYIPWIEKVVWPNEK